MKLLNAVEVQQRWRLHLCKQQLFSIEPDSLSAYIHYIMSLNALRDLGSEPYQPVSLQTQLAKR